MIDSRIQLETGIIDILSQNPDWCNYALIGYVDALQLNLTDARGSFSAHLNDSAVVAQIDNRPCGILVFGSNPYAIGVRFAYVNPNYRRRGIFRYMYEELIKWCERVQAKTIEFESPIQNTDFSKVLVACGANIVSQCYRAEIE